MIAILYRIYTQLGQAKLYTEVHSFSKLPYFTVKEMRVRYPDGIFAIIGEIGDIARPPGDGDFLLTGDGKVLPILPRGSLKKPFEWITGYIEVEKNTYIAVIGGFFHLLSYMSERIRINLRV